MNRIPIQPELSRFPEEFHELLTRHRVYDSSCSEGARVYFIDGDGGLFLKTADRGALSREAVMTRYFHKKCLGAQVLGYRSLEQDWLLTARVPGEDCLDKGYLDDPPRLCDTLAEAARNLHSIDLSDCPIPIAPDADFRPVLIHGDFCLPNVMLDDWKLRGFIDLGDAGPGDRHVDLFWAMWSMGYNLGTNRYGPRFLDAYGREDYDPARLHAVASAVKF